MEQQKHAGRRNGFLRNADCGADRRGGIAGHFGQFWHACRTMQNGDFGKFCYTQLRHSLCHGWASGPTSFLSRHVLGIKPIEEGYKKIKIEPHLGALVYAEGKIPTPYGMIMVRHERTDKDVKTDMSVPDGLEIVN